MGCGHHPRDGADQLPSEACHYVEGGKCRPPFCLILQGYLTQPAPLPQVELVLIYGPVKSRFWLEVKDTPPCLLTKSNKSASILRSELFAFLVPLLRDQTLKGKVGESRNTEKLMVRCQLYLPTSSLPYSQPAQVPGSRPAGDEVKGAMKPCSTRSPLPGPKEQNVAEAFAQTVSLLLRGQ